MNRLVRYLFASFFALILATLIYQETAEPELAHSAIKTSDVLILGLLFGGVGFGVYGFREYGLDGRFVIALFTYLLCMLLLIAVLFQQRGSGFPNPGRAAKLTLIVLVFLFFIGVAVKQKLYLKRAGVFLLAFAVLFSIYVSHAVRLAAGSGLATFALISGFMMGLCLFVLPRYVSHDAFLWIISLISGFTALLGTFVYSVGEYSIFGRNVLFWKEATFTPLFLDMNLRVIKSIYVNPNELGFVTFAGTVSAVILVHRLLPDTGSSTNESRHVRADGSSASVLTYPFVVSVGLSCVAGGLFVISAVGLFLSNSRASYLVTAIALALYFSSVVFGRRSIPYAMAGLGGTVALLVLLLPVFGINPSGRYTLWGASVEYLSRNMSLLGAGIEGPGTLIEPYVEKPYRGQAPHNGYLSVFLRAGLLGGVVYLVIIVGSLIAGVIRHRRVSVPALVLAFSFAIHQFFESYRLFHHNVPSVIATLVFGFLILDGYLTDEEEEESSDEREPLRRSRRRSRSDWKR